jgi:translation initiation factor IF-1
VLGKKETILLDARLITVIDNNAFGAVLLNGHRFVAFFRRGETPLAALKIGDDVRVEMSPFDMSKGRLVINQEQ